MWHRHGGKLAAPAILLVGCLGMGGDWFVPRDPGVVDLVAQSVQFECDPAFAGELNPVRVRIGNLGSAAAPQFSYVVKLLPGETTVIIVPVLSLGAGQAYDEEIPVPLPDGLAEGTYTLLLEVDPADAVEELDEENNSVESPSPVLARARVADISVDSVSSAEHNVSIGGPLHADVTFSNSGTDPVPSFEYRAYLSTDTVPGGDIFVGTDMVVGIAAGSTAAASLNATVPGGVAVGSDYYLIIEADPTDLVSETDEGNNTGYDPVPFHVPAARKRRAVVVGISDYLEIGDLTYCDDDATDFASTLLAADEWTAPDVDVLTNQFAYRADIEGAILDAGAQLSAGDMFVFFFSGHGGYSFDLFPFDEADGLDEYICPHDSDESVWDKDIRDDMLEQWFQDYIPAGVEICIILDTCNSGGMAKGKLGGSSLAEGLADDFRRHTKDIDDISPLVGLFASAETEDSWESPALQHGVFTYFVLEALNVASADTDSNGWFSAEEVFYYAEPWTYQWSVAFYWPDVQSPQLVDNCPGELDLRTVQ